MDEQWLPVPGFETYSVSDLGRVRGSRGGILKPRIGTGGYPNVAFSIGGKNHVFAVHRLVATVFHGAAPEGQPVCRHINGNPQDNRPSNLAWSTYSENNFDTVRHGNHHNSLKGECPQGHDYSLHGCITKNNRRICRLCQREHRRNSRQRNK